MLYYGCLISKDNNSFTFNVITENVLKSLLEINIWEANKEQLGASQYLQIFSSSRLIKGVKNSRTKTLRKLEWYKFNINFKDQGDENFFNSISAKESKKVKVESINFIDGRSNEGREIHRAFSLDDFNETSTEKISQVLSISISKLRRSHFLACYYVGQGSCNAICNADGRPEIYFDLGGGYGANKHTYPSKIKLCSCSSPTIILSHWDGDHWKSIREFPKFEKCNWIIPKQKLSHDALKTAHSIHKSGCLLMWPSHLSKLKVGPIQIIKCTGTSINSSGLAIRYKPNTHQDYLLPGDAAYNKIPTIYDTSFNTLVVTHHGGKGYDSPPDPKESNFAVYSYGLSNTHSHPLPNSIATHKMVNWKNSYDNHKGHIAIGTVLLNHNNYNNHCHSTKNCNTLFMSKHVHL